MGIKKTLMTLLLSGAMALPFASCSEKPRKTTPGNSAPVITSTAPTQANHNILYAYDVQATDADGDDLEFFLTENDSYSIPEGMTMTQINANTAQINWTPTQAQTNNSYPIQINVGDGKDITSKEVVINVSNTSPEFTSTPLTIATEKQLYEYIPSATDNEGDNITFSIQGTLPTWLNFNSETGRIFGTPQDAHSDETYQITLRANDGIPGGITDKTWNVYVRNVADITGVINEINPEDIPIQGIEVKVGDRTAITNSLGQFIIQDKPDGEYQVMIRDPLGEFVTYKPGILEVTKTREHNNKLSNLEFRLMPEEHYQFIDECARTDGGFFPQPIQKWGEKPRYIIYTRYYPNNEPIEQDKLDLVQDIILNRLSGKFTDANQNIMHFSLEDLEFANTMIEGGLVNGHIKVYWRNDMYGGDNYTSLDGNKIIYAMARGPPYNPASAGEHILIQELAENMIAGGETQDDNYIDSTLHDPGSGATNFSNNDELWINYHKNRPIGNRDLRNGNLDDRDVNPAGTYINP